MSRNVLHMPLGEEEVRQLKVGDVVYLTGHIFTARDMAHLKSAPCWSRGGSCPRTLPAPPCFTPVRSASRTRRGTGS